MIEQIKFGQGTIEALGQFGQGLKEELLKKAAQVPFGVKPVEKHDFGPEEEGAVRNPKTGESGVARLLTRMILENDPNLKFSDLAGEGLSNKEALEQSDELIREKAKEFVFKTLITHGKLRTDAKTGKLELKDKTDLDGQICLVLLKEAGIDISKVNYIPQDDESKLSKSGFAFDVTKQQGWVLKNDGKLMVVSDKDRSSGTDSTAKFIHEGLVEFGLLPKDSKILERIVEFATKEDNMDYKDKEVEDIFDNYHQNLMGLRNYLDVGQLLKVFRDQMKINSEFNPYEKIDPEYLKTLSYTDPKTGESCNLKKAQDDLREHKRISEREIEKIKKEGFVLNTGDNQNGDVLFDLGRKKDGKHLGPRVKLGYIAARRFGFGGYVIYNNNEDGGFCSIQTTKGMNFTLPEGFRVSDRYYLIAKKRGEGSLQTTLEDVMKNLSGESDHYLLSIKVGNALRKILNKQAEISSVRRTGPAVGEMRENGSVRELTIAEKKEQALGIYIFEKFDDLLKIGEAEGDDLAERVIQMGGEMGLTVDNNSIEVVTGEIRSKKKILISSVKELLTESSLPILELEGIRYIIKNQGDVNRAIENILDAEIRKLLRNTAFEIEEVDILPEKTREELQMESIDAIVPVIRTGLSNMLLNFREFDPGLQPTDESIIILFKREILDIYNDQLRDLPDFEGANPEAIVDIILGKVYN